MTQHAFIKVIREALGSQRAFAKQIGVTQAYVCDILHGRREVSENFAAKCGFTKTVQFQEKAGH